MILTHDDIEEHRVFINAMTHQADILFDVTGLVSGYSKDVHGTVKKKKKKKHIHHQHNY